MSCEIAARVMQELYGEERERERDAGAPKLARRIARRGFERPRRFGRARERRLGGEDLVHVSVAKRCCAAHFFSSSVAVALFLGGACGRAALDLCNDRSHGTVVGIRAARVRGRRCV